MSLVFLSLLLLSGESRAGDHRELCEKVETAAAVVEIQFQQVATWSDEYKDKGWPPPASELLQTAATGRILRVFKGDLEEGMAWQEGWGENFTISGLEDWGVFMSQAEFSQVWFMDGLGGTTGWAEESAGCGSSDQDSWCEGFEHFKTRIAACMSPTEPDPVRPPPDPEPPREDPLAD